jgi:hypothetical protein
MSNTKQIPTDFSKTLPPHVNDHPPQHFNSWQSHRLPCHPPNLLLQHPRPSLFAKPPSLPGRPSHIFSKKTLNLIEHVIDNNQAPSTISRYSQAIHKFTCFCVKEKVPHNLCFPADEFVLCAYATSCVGLNGKTVQKRFSGLKTWHHAHNADWQRGMQLCIVINGVSNLAPPSSTQPPQPSINSTMLSQLITSLDPNDPFDAVVAVCTCIAFWGQCRLGELLASSFSSSEFSTTTRSARSHIGPSK